MVEARLVARAAGSPRDPSPALAELLPESTHIARRRAFGYSSRAVGGV
jgi:hypothetical protein